jgi:hypothetical protein
MDDISDASAGCNMRDEPSALVWPRLLEFTSDDVPIVYLDLCHWISLAQASVGHPKGDAFAKTLEACRAAVSASAAVFVLSSAHYGEMLKIKDPAQRQKIACVMEELTGFTTLVGRVVVMELELAAMLDQFRENARPLASNSPSRTRSLPQFWPAERTEDHGASR